MAFKMKNPSLMKMAKEAGSAMKLKKEPMKMKKAAPMKEMKGDLDKDGKKERVMRSAAYMSYQKALGDWGSEDFTNIDAAIKKAEDYDPSA